MGKGLTSMKTDGQIKSAACGETRDPYDEARENIRQGAGLNRTYIIMNILSAIMACYGLFENSPAVVIGAMVVALLLGPIIGLALALVEGNYVLLGRAALAEVVGTAAVYLTALIIGLLNRNIPITNEIMVRTAPNFFDLMIAPRRWRGGGLFVDLAQHWSVVGRCGDCYRTGTAAIGIRHSVDGWQIHAVRRCLLALPWQSCRYRVRVFYCLIFLHI